MHLKCIFRSFLFAAFIRHAIHLSWQQGMRIVGIDNRKQFIADIGIRHRSLRWKCVALKWVLLSYDECVDDIFGLAFKKNIRSSCICYKHTNSSLLLVDRIITLKYVSSITRKYVEIAYIKKRHLILPSFFLSSYLPWNT